MTNLPRGTLPKIIAEDARLKALGDEYVQNRRDYRKVQVERYTLHGQALAFVIRLNKLEVNKRQEFLHAVLDYGLDQGFFDQTDAFDDLATKLHRILTTEAEWTEAAPKPNNAELLLEGITALDDLTAAA